MSTIPTFQTDHSSGPSQSSNGLAVNLSSNNPFRNRAASPVNGELISFDKPASPFDDPPPRPLSRNPFIDQVPPPARSPGVMSTRSDNTKSLSAEEIFDSLTLDDKSANQRQNPPGPRRPMDRPPGVPPPGAPRRGENVPPPGNSSHHPSRSQEEALKARRMQNGPSRPGPPDSPQRKPPQQRRPRRNSDSSLMDFDARPLTDEEKRMIEAKRRERERERQRREGKERSNAKERSERSSNKSGRPSRRMDIIDQLDATSIYGTGLFHHDGPFDALNPHRNRQNSRRAPMQAFPKDSLNNSLGGAGPLNKEPDHSTFMGVATDEAFRDFSTGAKANGYYSGPREKEPPIFNPVARDDIVHGDETHGLGTSTFLEGTPAARSAIVRHQEERAQDSAEIGLQRKKSLAQRIRHINKSQRDFAPSGRMTNPESAYNRMSPDAYPSATSNGSDKNPFFQEFSKGEESISVRRRDGAMSPTGPPTSFRRGSAGNPLERRATTDNSAPYDDSGTKPTGILGRMKSLKGGKRSRNDASNAAPAPGTAV